MSTSRRAIKVGRRRGKTNGESRAKEKPSIWPGMTSGRYKPLSDKDLINIRQAIFSLLIKTGISDATPSIIERVTSAGGSLSNDGRLTFSEELIERGLKGFNRDFTLCGQNPEHDMVISGSNVHLGTGGAAPLILDMNTGKYRQSNLKDLYDAARLIDALPNIHFFSRSLVARDMPDMLSLDVNTVYASLAGTNKHIFGAACNGENVGQIAQMCYQIAGSKEAYVARPFLSMNVNHITPPMRFSADGCDVLEQSALHDIPIHSNIFAQTGASTPVTLAGSMAQSAAESIAGGIFAWLVNPKAKIIFGPRPMIVDLRTGGMSGGGGEQALAVGATAQLMQFLNLPNSCIAGAADSKVADAQSGYEKSITVSLAAQAGCNLVTQSCGMQASLMAVALESYVIDNDMLGGIMSSLRPLEVTEQTLAIDSIDKVVRGIGHFMGEPETYKRMKSDFTYPDIADRRSTEEWEDDGSQDIRTIALQRTRKLLDSHYPQHLSCEIDQELRAQFDIRLSSESMVPITK